VTCHAKSSTSGAVDRSRAMQNSASHAAERHLVFVFISEMFTPQHYTGYDRMVILYNQLSKAVFLKQGSAEPQGSTEHR
jgi:hypothetical protein